jgi:hypothetical protein
MREQRQRDSVYDHALLIKGRTEDDDRAFAGLPPCESRLAGPKLSVVELRLVQKGMVSTVLAKKDFGQLFLPDERLSEDISVSPHEANYKLGGERFIGVGGRQRGFGFKLRGHPPQRSHGFMVFLETSSPAIVACHSGWDDFILALRRKGLAQDGQFPGDLMQLCQSFLAISGRSNFFPVGFPRPQSDRPAHNEGFLAEARREAGGGVPVSIPNAGWKKRCGN